VRCFTDVMAKRDQRCTVIWKKLLFQKQDIQNWLHKALSFVLPPRCTHCSAKIAVHGFLCTRCWGELQPLAPPFCSSCALPYEFSVLTEGDEAEVACAACLKEPPVFDWARAAVSYEGLGRSLVLRLKYNGASMVVPVMAKLMASSVRGSIIEQNMSLVIPVPLHQRRFISRRFNQSQLLAKELATLTGVPMNTFVLVRNKSTPSQGGLNRKKRFKNVKGAFAIRHDMAELVKGRHIVLVDDVLTTGATASACAKVLKNAGALSVGLAVFARVGEPLRP